MTSSVADSSKTLFDTGSKAIWMSRYIVAERDLYPVLKAFVGAAVYINVAMVSIVSTPHLKHREYWLTWRAYHLAMASTNQSNTFQNSGSNEMGRCVLFFLGIDIILAIFK